MRIFSLLSMLALVASLATPALASDDAKARELINSLGCKGCHSFEGSGGTLGPALDGTGKRLNEKQIEAKLLNPKATNAASMMPAYGHLGKNDIEALVDFLAELK